MNFTSIRQINAGNFESYEIIDAYDKKKGKSAIGRAVVGTVVAGPIGTVAGAITGVGSKHKGRKMSILVTLKDGQSRVFEGDTNTLNTILTLSQKKSLQERTQEIRERTQERKKTTKYKKQKVLAGWLYAIIFFPIGVFFMPKLVRYTREVYSYDKSI